MALVPVLGLLLPVQRDHVVDAEDGDRRLRRELQDLHLAQGRLQHASLHVVPDYPCHNIFKSALFPQPFWSRSDCDVDIALRQATTETMQVLTRQA